MKDELNKCDSIEFTLEIETNNCLPLDVMIKNTPVEALNTTVYRKPTATGQYSDWKSNHVKIGVSVGLIERAKSCSNNILLLRD